jgi:hypothetical protein
MYKKRGWRCGSSRRGPSKREALTSNLSTTQKKKENTFIILIFKKRKNLSFFPAYNYKTKVWPKT